MPSKKSKLQLYADECFPVPAVTYLKSLGYSIIHSYDKNFIQKSDQFHLLTSKKLGRILITLDRDFNDYETADLKGYPGVIIISAGSTTPLHIIKVCKKVLKFISQDLAKESLIKVTIDKLIKIKNGEIVYEKLL
ncbi:DUF5615 family PIN-like protein [Candidatus Daviesbacteria bacterium]|nr:DUF5615 family PIN-like protein [Candidatus Daviesbacteria bacterium]MBI4035329.1 DUF5615 family PIN-like protein [Candidatus Daviesbacteria bacterium]